MKKFKILAAMLLVGLTLSFLSLPSPKAQTAYMVFLPSVIKGAAAIQVPDPLDILTLRQETLPGKGVSITGAYLEWDNQNWDSYVVFFRQPGATKWCNTGINPMPEAPSYYTYFRSSSLWHLFNHHYVPYKCGSGAKDRVFEFMIADNLPGQETNVSNLITYDLGNIVPTTVLDPEPLVIIDTDTEAPGNILIRWQANGYVETPAQIYADGVIMGHVNYYERSRVLKGFTPGDTITFTFSFCASGCETTITY